MWTTHNTTDNRTNQTRGESPFKSVYPVLAGPRVEERSKSNPRSEIQRPLQKESSSSTTPGGLLRNNSKDSKSRRSYRIDKNVHFLTDIRSGRRSEVSNNSSAFQNTQDLNGSKRFLNLNFKVPEQSGADDRMIRDKILRKEQQQRVAPKRLFAKHLLRANSFQKENERPKSAGQYKRGGLATLQGRELQSAIRKSNMKRFQAEKELPSQPGIRDYTQTEKFLMRTMYEMFQFIGETEIHIEKIRQKVAKQKTFECYDAFRAIGGRDSMKSQLGINHKHIYDFILEHTNNKKEFEENFTAEDIVHLVSFHSHNRDGHLSFTDFNQMVLPTQNHKLRAKATQRQNIFQTTSGVKDIDTAKAMKAVTQLLIAEACFNLDLEILKTKLEQSDKGFNTKHLFELIDIRQFSYLDMKSIQIFMEQYYRNMQSQNRKHSINPYKLEHFYLDSRPQFYKAIMRRLGLDTTQRIDYREFSNIVKPSVSEVVVERFKAKYDQDRVAGTAFIQQMNKQKLRDSEKGRLGELDHVGPLKAFRSIMIDHSNGEDPYRKANTSHTPEK